MRHTATMLASTALLALASACSDSAEPLLPDAGATSRQVGFTITVADIPDTSDSSRATPADGTYDPGEGYENYINIENNDFKFYFFSADDKFIDEIKINSLTPVSVNPLQSSKTYEALGKVDSSIAGLTSFKVCVLANWSQYPELSAGDDLDVLWSEAEANIYKFRNIGLSRENAVPLYGIREFVGVKFNPDEFKQLGRIHLLRAFAKVEVNLDLSVHAVNGLFITRVNSTGSKAPANVRVQADYVHGSYDPDYVNKPNLPAGVQVVENIPMALVAGEAGAEQSKRKYVAYLPEYDNTSASAVKTSIIIDFKNPSDADRAIEFKYYQATGSHAENEPFDILRNYLYRFNLKQEGIFVDVQPYAEVKLAPDFGLERDADGNIIVRNGDGEIIKMIIVGSDQVLDFDNISIPNIGEATGVFDQSNKVLLAYLPDGRQMIYNYTDDSHAEFVSWEIYSVADEYRDTYLMEEYEAQRYNWADGKYYQIYCHNFYDERGCLIKRVRYNSDKDFQDRTKNCYVAVDWEPVNDASDEHGEKNIYYYERQSDGTLKKFMIVEVRRNADGTYTETYRELVNEKEEK